MQPLKPPESHCLRAAAGWLELGCPEDALSELEALSPESRDHPDVLEVRWLIEAEQQHWGAALSAATQLVHIAPDRPTGWLHRAYAMRRVPEGGLEKAWELLLPAAEKFPKESVIPYNLACYACQLGHLEESRRWFHIARNSGQAEQITRMALKDEDLRPLWDEIRSG